MHARNFLRLCFLPGLNCFLPVTVQAAEAGEKEKIEALIRHVENLKGASFIRNGKSYDAKNAAKFLRGKWDAKEKEIKTAEEFIAKVATVSSTTGKPYLIKFSDGREVKCGEYLTGELKK